MGNTKLSAYVWLNNVQLWSVCFWAWIPVVSELQQSVWVSLSQCVYCFHFLSDLSFAISSPLSSVPSHQSSAPLPSPEFSYPQLHLLTLPTVFSLPVCSQNLSDPHRFYPSSCPLSVVCSSCSSSWGTLYSQIIYVITGIIALLLCWNSTRKVLVCFVL